MKSTQAGWLFSKACKIGSMCAGFEPVFAEDLGDLLAFDVGKR